ncbi:MAG: hypothetical protein KAT34_17945 [Candidatus Aminicenantes bacterium]|nr:hypothetical protein [Candidatus Aminicenantes bacterium]
MKEKKLSKKKASTLNSEIGGEVLGISRVANITSGMIMKADGSSGQDIKKGAGIKRNHIQDRAISSAKIKNAGGKSGQDTTRGSGIKTKHIQDNAVTEPKLADGSVTELKLGADSVTSSKIKDGNVITTKLADSSVTNDKLNDGSVNEDKLSADVKEKLVTNGNNHTHSAADVGALPITGGAVNGDVHVLGTLLGAVKDDSGNQLKIVCGKTPEGNTNWIQCDDPAGLYVDVSVSGFKSIPYYFVDVFSASDHILAASASYTFSKTHGGLRIYIKYPFPVTPDNANKHKWHVEWLAIGT